MTLPLYAGARTGLPGTRPESAHLGLWFDKYCGQWSHDGNSWGLGTRKLNWLKTFAGTSGNGSQLTESTLRRVSMVEAKRGRWGILETTSRFLTGIGLPSPTENGFLWHPSLGVPFIAGSSIKGLIKAASDLDGSVFGSGNSAGSFAFLDAIPYGPVETDVDVITPHYGGWNPMNPPGDWMSPNPIPFLTVRPGSAFLFSVIPLDRSSEADQDSEPSIDAVWDALVEVLEFEGAGAKSAVGYGLFTPSQSGNKQVLRWYEEASASSDSTGRAAAFIHLRGMSGPEIWNTFRRAVSGSHEDHGGEPAVVVAELLADPAFFIAWREAKVSIGMRGIEQHESFLSAWRQGRKVDPQTKAGSKKLKDRAKQLTEMLDKDAVE